jgi:hypothetical protein
MSTINTGKTYGSDLEIKSYEESFEEGNWEDYGEDYGSIEDPEFEDEFIESEPNGIEEKSESCADSLSEMEALLIGYEEGLASDSTLPEGLKASLQEKINEVQRNLGFAQMLTGKAQQNTLSAVQAGLCEIEQSFAKGMEAAPLIEELDSLIADLEATEFPETQQQQKTEWLEKLGKAKHALELNADPAAMEAAGQLVGDLSYQLEEAKAEIEEQTAALNAPFESLLAVLQSTGDTTSTLESLKQALSECGLTPQDLQSLSLPADAEKHKKIFQFIEKVDANFAQLLADNAEDPYADAVLNRFTQILSQFAGNAASITPENVKKIFKDQGLFFYPESGEVAKYIFDSNNGMEAKGFANAIEEALESGDWESVRMRFINLSGEQGNDIMRKFITGLYFAVGEDEALFQKALDRIPADVRESMANIAYACWAERSEKFVEDKWNSHETRSILYNSIFD